MSTLPRNFSWIERSVLAGRPESVAELDAAKREGIEAIVSLTRNSTHSRNYPPPRLRIHALPLSTMPTTQQLAQIAQFIESQKSQAHPVLVHCGEGKGRTGTVLAAYLVYSGMHADEEIQLVREQRPESIQSAEQEMAIHEFEKVVIKDRDT